MIDINTAYFVMESRRHDDHEQRGDSSTAESEYVFDVGYIEDHHDHK